MAMPPLSCYSALQTERTGNQLPCDVIGTTPAGGSWGGGEADGAGSDKGHRKAEMGNNCSLNCPSIGRMSA